MKASDPPILLRPKTSLLALTWGEWQALAVICVWYMKAHPEMPKRHHDLAKRVLEAANS